MLYTLFYQANIQGLPVARALFFQYPTDKNTLALDTQFMWGTSLLITPVLTQGAVTVDGYFPADVWYDFFTGEAFTSTGETRTLDAPLEKIPLHVRGGSIIVTQQPATTTKKSRTQPFSLIVALSANGSASGELFLDDGESLNTLQSGQYTLVSFTAQGGSQGNVVSSVPVKGFAPSAQLTTINVWGVSASPSSVTLNGNAVQFAYNASTKTLAVTALQVELTAAFSLAWQ